MELPRQVLFLTCTILFTLPAIVRTANEKEDLFEKFIQNVDDKTYWRKENPDKNASLINVKATCISMEMIESPNLKDGWPLHIFLDFNNASEGIEQYDVGVKKSIAKTKNTLNMTFLSGGPYTEYTGPKESSDPKQLEELWKQIYEESMKGELVNRTVEYTIQSTDSNLSILKKEETKDEGCSYWLLYSTKEEPSKTWTLPQGETCQIEVHTTKKPDECPERKD
uniref:Putative salivary lipocalin n=1 Tax=Ixodes ricinus TaxID=34613 RepID=A0A6B0V495_IXORI